MGKKSKRLRKMRRDAEKAFSANSGTLPVSNKSTGYNWNALTCQHYAEMPVFETGKLRIFAATSNTARWIKDAAFFINCSDFGHNRDAIQAPAGFESLGEYNTSIPMLSIPWPDGSAPEVKPKFWNALARLLVQKIEGDVIVYCLGSHGRTGTALACLRLQFAPFITAQQAIAEVRRAHCPDAIETDSQIDYIYTVALATGGLDMVQDQGARPVGAMEVKTLPFPSALKQAEEQCALLLPSPEAPKDDIAQTVIPSLEEWERAYDDGVDYDRDNGNEMLGAWSDTAPVDLK